MSSIEHGYDEEFVDVPADYLKCVMCQFVLRDPVLLTACGHHYCHNCFEQIKGYSAHFASDLCCPIDRTVIDSTKVCKDICIKRIIEDLYVKCTFSNQGCNWVGELQDLEAHKDQCYAVKNNSADQATQCSRDDDSSTTRELIKRLSERMEQCERFLLTKENETKEKVTKRNKELEELKQKMLECEKRNISNYEEIEKLMVGRKLQEKEQKRVKNEVGKLKQKVNVCTKKETQPYESFVETIETNLNHFKSELKDLITNIEECLNDKVNYQALDKIFYEIDGLRTHATHADMVIPTIDIIDTGKNVFVWRIRDFNEAIYVYFSKFFCHPSGYRWFFRFGYDVDSTYTRSLTIKLVKDDKDEFIREFSNNVFIELVTNDASEVSKTIFSQNVYYNGEEGGEYQKLCDVSEVEYEKFILNGTLTIRCTIQDKQACE